MGIGDSASPGYAAFNSSRHQLSGIALSPVHVIQDDRGIDEGSIPALIGKLNPLIQAALQSPMSEPEAHNGMTLMGTTPHIVSVSAFTPVGPQIDGYEREIADS